MFPVLQIGPLALQTPGFILILGLWLGLTLAERWAYHFQTNANTIYNLVFNTLIAGLIGARLVYFARYASIFIESPLNLISLNPGLFDPLGGLAVGLLTALIYGNRNKLVLWSTLDAITPILGVFAVALGLSHLASGDAFGVETNLPWGINLWGVIRHPTQVYEIVYALIALGAIWFNTTKLKSNPMIPGEIFLFFVAFSSIGRLFLEAFRGDSIILAGNVRLVQIGAWITLALSLWGLIQLKFSEASLNEKK